MEAEEGADLQEDPEEAAGPREEAAGPREEEAGLEGELPGPGGEGSEGEPPGQDWEAQGFVRLGWRPAVPPLRSGAAPGPDERQDRQGCCCLFDAEAWKIQRGNKSACATLKRSDMRGKRKREGKPN